VVRSFSLRLLDFAAFLLERGKKLRRPTSKKNTKKVVLSVV